jgi:hypothetical protein
MERCSLPMVPIPFLTMRSAVSSLVITCYISLLLILIMVTLQFHPVVELVMQDVRVQ